MPKIEGHGIRHLVVDTQPFTTQRTPDDEQQGEKQDIHAEALPGWFLLADERADEESRCQPRGRDPEQSQLNVPGSRHAIGQPPRQWNSVESVPFDAVMGRDDSQKHLQKDQKRDHPEVLDCGLL